MKTQLQRIRNTTISSLSPQKKKLLKISPGFYFKLDNNERQTVESETTGLVVSSYDSQMSGETVYNVTLVNGELLLIPEVEKVKE